MAQSLSGTVTDKSTKESLISATVQLISSEGKSSYTSTDLNGFFQFKKLQPGTYTLQITYVGYKAYKEKLDLSTKQQRQVKIAKMPGYWEKYPYRVVQPVPNRKVTV